MSSNLEAILKDKKTGCTSLAIKLFSIFEETLLQSKDKADFVMKAEIMQQKIKDAHQSMYGLHNLWYMISHYTRDKKTLEECKLVLQGVRMKILKGIDEVALQGSNIIEEGDQIMTISNSFLVLQAATRAIKKHNFSFLCLRSLPGGEGEEMMFSLNRKKILSTLVEDKELKENLAKTTKVFISCDALFQGKFINKKGTSQLVQEARECSIPIYLLVSPLAVVDINSIGSIAIDETLFEKVLLTEVQVIK